MNRIGHRLDALPKGRAPLAYLGIALVLSCAFKTNKTILLLLLAMLTLVAPSAAGQSVEVKEVTAAQASIPPFTIQGDFDCNCIVDVADIMEVVSRLGTICTGPTPGNRPATVAYDARYDLNGDCAITGSDLQIEVAHWRDTCPFTISLAASPATPVSVIPVESIPFTILRNINGTQTPLKQSDVRFRIADVSGSVNGKVIQIFDQGDIEKQGQVIVSPVACAGEALSVSVPVGLVELNSEDQSALDTLSTNLQQKLDNYLMARANFNQAKEAFKAEHMKLAAGTAPSDTIFESFVFNTSFSSLAGGSSQPACSEIRLLGGQSIPCDQGFFKLNGSTAPTWSFILDPSNKRLLSNGSLGDCPYLPLTDPNGCSRIFFHVEFELNKLAQPDVQEALVQLHTQLGPNQNINVIAVSYMEGDTPKQPAVQYLLNPPGWCGVVQNTGGTIAAAPLTQPDGQTGATGCGSLGVGIQPPSGVGTSKVVWTLEGYSQPRENWIMQGLARVAVQITTSRFTDLGDAETTAMRLFYGMLKQELELAMQKQQALVQLGLLGQTGTSHPLSVDYVKEFWKDQLDKLVDVGEEKVTEEIIDKVEDQLGLPLGELSEQLSEASGLIGKMKTATDLFNLLSSGDTSLPPTEVLRKIKEAFDLARALGPGSPMVTAIGPFLDFYSKALGAIADALDKIDGMRKEQVISTGACEIIDSLIPPNDPRKLQWQKACQIRNLLQRVKDP
ncbi:MAG: hypothetical protein HY326_02225 [Chloroflexi bacterium]|nr:hypothetical protein [Chloroflexota bacterium]